MYNIVKFEKDITEKVRLVVFMDGSELDAKFVIHNQTLSHFFKIQSSNPCRPIPYTSNEIILKS
jgi:hypothetical protein